MIDKNVTNLVFQQQKKTTNHNLFHILRFSVNQQRLDSLSTNSLKTAKTQNKQNNNNNNNKTKQTQVKCQVNKWCLTQLKIKYYKACTFI